jgi:hypothetical protein
MPRQNIDTEVFENFLKLAQKEGLVATAAKKEPNPDDSKKLLEKNPRWSWQDADTISALYGVKPDLPESMKYERNIIEDAHPNACVLAPAYDRLNALVENNNERQNIMLHIVHKTPDGNYTHHRYAQSELMQSLVRTANHLENQSMAELRVLADVCIEQLYAKAFGLDDVTNLFQGGLEEVEDVGSGAGTAAVLGGVTGGIIGAFTGPQDILPGAWLGARIAGAAGGVLSAIFKTAPQAKNVAINAQEALDATVALMQEHANDPLLHSLATSLKHIGQTANLYAQTVDQMHMQTNDPSAKHQAESVATAYLDEITQLNHLADVFINAAEQGRYASQESDWWAKLKTPITGIFGDNVHKAIGAMKALETTTKTASSGINSVMQEIHSVATAPSAATNPTIYQMPQEPDFEGEMAGLQEEMANFQGAK